MSYSGSDVLLRFTAEYFVGLRLHEDGAKSPSSHCLRMIICHNVIDWIMRHHYHTYVHASTGLYQMLQLQVEKPGILPQSRSEVPFIHYQYIVLLPAFTSVYLLYDAQRYLKYILAS